MAYETHRRNKNRGYMQLIVGGVLSGSLGDACRPVTVTPIGLDLLDFCDDGGQSSCDAGSAGPARIGLAGARPSIGAPVIWNHHSLTPALQN
jgi:hypothetical protein